MQVIDLAPDKVSRHVTVTFCVTFRETYYWETYFGDSDFVGNILL